MTDKPMTVGEVMEKLSRLDPNMPVFRWTSTFYAPICSIDQVSFDTWAEEQDEEDLDEQGLERQDFPFVEILFND